MANTVQGNEFEGWVNPFSATDTQNEFSGWVNPFQTQEKGEGRGIGGIVSDLGVSAAAGSNALMELAGTLYGLTTGDMENYARQQGARGREYWNSRKTPELKQLEADRKSKVDAADGQLAKLGTAFWETFSSPSLLAAYTFEQIPNLIVTGGAGRAAGAGVNALLKKTGQDVSEKVVNRAARAGAVTAGGAMQGADVGGQAYDELMALPDSVWLANPRLQERINGNMDLFPRAKREIATELSRTPAIASGVMSIGLNSFPIFRILEDRLAGVPGSGSRLANAAKGFAGESLGEGVEEGSGVALSNVAVAQIDPTKSISEGVGEAAGMGMAAGPMGAIAGLTRGDTGAADVTRSIFEAPDVDSAIDAANSALDAFEMPGVDFEVPNAPIPNPPGYDTIPGAGMATIEFDDTGMPILTEEPGTMPAPGAEIPGVDFRTRRDDETDAAYAARMEQEQAARDRDFPAAMQQKAEQDMLRADLSTTAAPENPAIANALLGAYLKQAPESTQSAVSARPATDVLAAIDRIAVPASVRTVTMPSGNPFPSEKVAKSSMSYRNNPGSRVVPAQGGGFQIEIPGKSDQEWRQFTPETGTLGVPRETMPQIKAEHRGAMVNFLKGRFISSEIQQVPAKTLKPTQAEFSPAKVKQALEYEGGNRSILVSSDNFVVDGHHQWLAGLDGDIQVIRIDAPVQEILDVIKEFPSATSGEVTATPSYSNELIAFARKAKSLAEVREFARKQFGPRAPQALEQAITGAWNIRNQEKRRRIGPDDSMATAIAKLGGIKTDWQQDITGDTKANKMIPGVGQVFSKNGTSPDDMAVRLLEEGYITQAEYDNMDGRDAIYEALNEELAGGRKKYKLDSLKAQEEMLQDIEDEYEQQEEAMRAQREQAYAEIEQEYGVEAAERARLYDEAQDNIIDDLLSDIDILNQLNQEREDARETDGEPGITFDEATGNREPIRGMGREESGEPSQAARGQAQDRGAARPVTSAPAPQAAASSEAVSVSEPVKWFGSEEKAAEWIEKQSSPSEYRIEPNNRRFEIFKNEPAPTKARLVPTRRADGSVEYRVDPFSQTVSDSREIAAGRLPIMDDRERQRLENVRKLQEQETESAHIGSQPRPEAPGTRTNGAIERAAADRLELLLNELPITRQGVAGGARMNLRSVIYELRRPKTTSSIEAMLESSSDILFRSHKPIAEVIDEVVEQLRAQPQPAAQAEPTYGQTNKVFTQDAAERAREILRKKLNQLNTGLDPEMVQAGITLAGYHIEAGARSFAAFSKAMISDLGDAVQPYLRSWYEGVRYYPGFDSEGMSTADEIVNSTPDNQPSTMNASEEVPSNGIQKRVPTSNADTGPENLSLFGEDGGDGRSPATEERRGAPDVQRPDSQRTEAAQRAPQGAMGEGGRGASVRGTDRVPAGRTESASAEAAGVRGENYAIEPGSLQENRGRAQKARDNIRAIELMREIEAEGRTATRAEQEQLARYVGWGGIKGAFPDPNTGKFEKGFEQVGERLKELLSETEYATARRSLQYAHYTAESVVRSMWDAVQRLGFTGGKVFEPGMGVGNFPGLMPADIAVKTDYNGLELDHTTARIARLLYPKWGIRQDDFTRAPLPKDTYDLVIGNPPFADVAIKSDPAYQQGFLLHDYFFAKSLDAVRPGGLLAFISSAGTMNKMDSSAREYMADRADFVGAIRLPGNAFEKNAGTSVTTDIIFLRKRIPGEENQKGRGFIPRAGWTDTVEVTLPNKEGRPTRGLVNRYFTNFPNMVLGEEGFFDPLYEGRYGVRAPNNFDIDVALNKAISNLPESIMSEWQGLRGDVDFGTSERKEGSFYVGKDGRLMQQRDGVGQAVGNRGKGVTGGKSLAEIERIKALIPLRDSLRAVYAADLAGETANADTARKRLNDSYDAFVKKFGPINQAEFQYRRPTIIQQESARMEAREEARFNGLPWQEGSFDASRMIQDGATLAQIARARADARENAQKDGRAFDEGSFDPDEMPDVVIEKRPNIDPFMDDPESYRLRSIEKYNDESGEARKSAVFTENVITRERTPEIKSVNDALLWTLNQKGRLDITDVSRLAGISESETIEQLGENIYRVPGTDNQWVTRDEYLSGNVRRKLRQARAAAARDQSLQRNVDALEAAQPAPLPPSEINANLGMPWIPTEIINQFGTESLGLTRMSVKYTPALGQWEVSGDSTSAAAQSTWGTKDRSAPQLVADALNRQDPRIYREGFADGKKTRELDPVATEAAQEKVREIKQRFSDWVWSDPARANRLAELYNEEYNNLVVREFDGSYLTTPGISSAWSWRPHQTRVIARVIQDGNTYMAHSVGAGKTSAMIGAGMEMRRLGLVRKPMYSVPNHMLGQFTKEFYEQYPTARIAVADERRFHTDRRKQFIADVANEDLDAIIITHSAFGMIPISDEFQDGLIQEQIEQYRDILSDVEKDQDARITRNRLENQIERLEQRLSGRGQRKRDQVFTFEEMGVDFLFVDEAHLYRKLDFATKMSNVKGISPEGSKASWDLYVKTRYLETINPGRNLVLASGTPVTNTMAELFTVSRYLQPQELRDRGLEHFDAWAGAFGDTVTNLEQDPAGGYKPVTRFAKFVNVPELSNMVRQTMDVVTGRQLEQYVTRPKIKGGTRKMNLAEKTEALKAYQSELARRMEEIAKRKGPPKPGDDIILSVINDGRHAAIDMRLVDPDLPNDPGSKLNLLIDNVYRIWSETKRQPFHTPAQDGYSEKPVDKGPAAQMIFANLGLSGSRGFAVPDFIRADLQRRGVPKDEIAYISDYKTHVARQRLFNDVNEGKVRVLIGSTAKMATGVNAQRRLYALHNLDPLWYPADDEQRNGRILRQGNMNPEIEINDYSTKGTYDSTMWGMMETKARFIQGFFEGDPNLRDMEDLGEASQYEQAKAMTTADPRLIELTDLRQKLERAHRRKAAFERELYANAQRVSKARDNISYYSKRIPAIEADIARRQDVSGDAFKAVVDGKTYTDRVEAGDILLGRIDLMKSDGREHRDEKVGEIGGFDILADVWGTSKERQANLVLNRTDDYQTEVKMSGSATGVIQSLSNALRNFDIDLDEARVRLQRAEKTVVEFAPQIDREFTGQGEIDQLIEQVRGLERELQSDSSQSPVDESAQIDTPAFSRKGKAKAFIPIDRAQALVSAITGRLENAPEVIVVQSMQDDQVPEAVRREDARQRSQGASGEPEGFYYRGKAYIVLDGLSRRKGENDAQALLRVFSHEILGHAGLRGLFRSDLDAVLNEVSLKRLSDVRKKAAEYGLDLADKRQRMEAAEEVLAEMAQTQPDNSLVTKAIEAVRRALRRMLMRLPADIRAMLGGGRFTQWVNAMTDAEIIDRFIVPAREFIRGGNQAGLNAMPAFMRTGPWYRSELQNNIGQIRQMASKQGMIGKEQAAQWIDAAIKKGLFKAEEVEWTGLREFIDLSDDRLSVDDIQAFVDGNGVRVETVVLQASNRPPLPEGWEVERQPNGEYYLLDQDGEVVSEGETEEEAIDNGMDSDELQDRPEAARRPKYASYQLPGGENYREVLLTLPAQVPTELPDGFQAVEQPGKEGSSRRWIVTGPGPMAVNQYASGATRAEAISKFVQHGHTGKPVFKSAHWDQPNVLAHVRMNDRTDSDGNKVLFIEEIQSDWAQEGRKKGIGSVAGYRVVEPSGQLFGEYQTRRDADGALQRAKPGSVVERSDTTYQGVPEAPFIGNTKAWTSLALKRILAIAAEGDYDKVAFVNGEQSADRYDLSKQIGEIRHLKQRDGSYDLAIKPKGGQSMLSLNGRSLSGLKESDLEDIVGKEVAQKIVAEEGPLGGDGFHKLSGLDLKVGGEGMKAFYDQIIPATLKDLSKKLGGGPLETVEIVERREGGFLGVPGITPMQEFPAKEIQLSQPGITITDAMREKVASGLPLFSRDMGDGQDDFNLEQYTEEEISQREQMGRDRKAQIAKALQKKDADDQLEEFVLTGSDSVADQAAARGQGSLFSRSKALPDTISIDGVQRSTTNSNGQPIAQTEEGVRNFWAWFGDSKVVDDQGRPLVVYHGTGADFDSFMAESDGNQGLYFSADPSYSGVYAARSARRGGNPNVMPVYLRIENPFTIDNRSWWDKVRGKKKYVTPSAGQPSSAYVTPQKLSEFTAQGYDGIINSPNNEIVAFNPTQIKSAIGNIGTFDPADSDIRFSRSSVVDFFDREQEQESEFAEENRRLRESDKTVWNKAKTLLRRQFAPGGLLPDSVFREKIARDGKLNVVEITVQSLVKEIEEAVRKEYGAQVRNLNETDMRRLSDALAGKMPANMKERTKTAIVAMRQYIDHLSEQYTQILRQQIDDLSRGMDDGELMLLDAFLRAGQIEPEGNLPSQKAAATRQRNKIMDEAKEAATAFWGDGKKMQAALGKAAQVAERASLMNIILNNQGKYVHRSYQVFDDPYWYRKIDPAVFDNAMNYLIDRYLEDGTMSRQEAIAKAEKVIDQIVKTDTAYSDMESFIKESKLGAKDLSVLKKRKDIAPEIRALMGEYIDPRINFAKTATKMGRLIFNQKFLDNVLEKGMGTFLFTEEDAPVGTEEIAAEGSEVYAPLNGLYAPREVIQAFKDVMGKEQMADWYRMIVQFNGLVKGGKTILSPTTSARNFQSAMFFALANGHWDLTQAKKSMALYRTFDSSAKLAYVKKMIDLGVIYDNPHAQEMMALLSESKFDSMFTSSQTAETIRNAWNLARDIYSFGDDFWKVIGFENEKAKLMKHAGMSEAAAEREAADRIRNLYPTYSMVGSAIQWLRRFPLVGTFVSFPAEIIRTSANMVRTVRKDWKTPGMRRIAIDRALGMAFVSGFAYAAQEIAKAMLDIDDDDEEAIRLQAAPWQRNSNLVITGRDEEGNLQYFDISFLDPYNYFKRPITAIMRDQPMGDALVSAASDMLSPFLGTDIAAGAIMEVYANKTGTGGPVYKESDSLDRQLIDIAQHLRKALQPGFVSNLERTYQALDGQTNASGKKFDLGDEGLSWIGWRVSTLDPKTALYYRSFEFSDAKAEASKTLTEVLNDPNDVSQQSIERAYERAVKMRAQAYNDMSKIVGASRRSGLSATQIRMVLKSGNVSEQDRQALIDGDVPAWRPTQQAETAAVRRAEALIGREKAMEIRSRYRMVRTLD